MIGRTLAHYRIVAALGAGGMGEVYRATDTRLGRDVALKILPADMATDSDRLDRFRREAKALAALDHPGIVTVFSVEEADHVPFLTMQLVEGEPLDRLLHGSTMPAERIIAIASGIAEALAAAHERGIVHRDLKPANIMIGAEDRVKILDFGLAKMSAAEMREGSQLATMAYTREGVVMGTVPYMSPEQVAGRPLDARTDIFSLGVILYEMATGRRPFEAASSAELASAILRDAPPPANALRADLPRRLSDLIAQCMAKDAAARPHSALAVRDALRAARTSRSGSVSTQEGFWVAVLPFRCAGSGDGLWTLAEGMTEEIVTGLSRFSYLKVIAHASSARYAETAADPREVGEQLGARYIMQGSLRRAGQRLRVAVQLVDATSGANLWAETWDRTIGDDDPFSLQDELVPRIVSTVADMNGVLPRSMSEAVRSRPPEQLSPYEAVLRSFAYFQYITAEELIASRAALEAALIKAPGYSDAWALLALMCAQDWGQGFGTEADPLARATHAARRAVETGPASPLAYFSLAQALFFQKDEAGFRHAMDRAVALNPFDGNLIAFVGEMLTYVGDSERGLEYASRAKRLNPNHPGWYWYADFFDAYRHGDDTAALALLARANLPGHWGWHCGMAMCLGQLGRREEAAGSIRRLLELRPQIVATARSEFAKWWRSELVERALDGLRKAGLEVEGERAPAPQSAAPATSATHIVDSGAARAQEGFWLAVLPFKASGASPDVATLAEGLSEEIVSGMSRFPWLRVVSRGSTLQYAGVATDVRAIGAELGARYVMEGSLRQSGQQLRVTAQLVDASNGAHLWAETYTRSFTPDQLFALQDDLVPRIVSTCADHFGVLARAISEAIRSKPIAQLTPYEAVMRGFGYHFRLDPEEHAQARAALELAVERAPANADCQAMLGWVIAHEHAHGFNPQPGSLERAFVAARRAVDLAPTDPLAWQALAAVLFFRKDMSACLGAAERAIALNPLDGSNEAFFLIAFAGDWERGCRLIRQAMERNPYHPGWYRLVLGLNEYRQGNYRAAIDEMVKGNLRASVWKGSLLAAFHAQAGDAQAARDALAELLAQKDDFASAGRAMFAVWFDGQLVEHLMDGLRRAGLDTT